jgi:predicted nucleic acid-binding protein
MQIIRLGQVKMCCSPALFLEYEEVLKRANQLAASGLLASDIDAILTEFAGLIEPVTTHYQWRPQLRDPADEMVLEAAANAQAHAIACLHQQRVQWHCAGSATPGRYHGGDQLRAVPLCLYR